MLPRQVQRSGSSGHLAGAEATLCAGEESADVLMMLDDDQQRDEQKTSDDNGCSEWNEVKAKQRKDGCRDDGSERDVAGDQKDDQKDAKDGQSTGPGKRKKYSESAGDAFAPAEAKPDGKDVAEDSSDSRSDSQVIVARREVLGDLYGHEGLAKIEQQRSDTETLCSRAGYVGGADVAAAGGTNVLLAKDSDKQVAKWD